MQPYYIAALCTLPTEKSITIFQTSRAILASILLSRAHFSYAVNKSALVPRKMLSEKQITDLNNSIQKAQIEPTI